MNRRRPAFDPSRLDDIDELLPPSPPATGIATTAPATDGGGPVLEPIGPAVGEELQGGGAARPAGEVARGQGGRPPRASRLEPGGVEVEDSVRVQVAVRISHTLYEQVNAQLLAGRERPSYGQLVLWACEDHPVDVAEQIGAARPGAGSRRPRGRRLAADTVQVTLRLTLTERGRLDEVADLVRTTHPGLVTRTEVAAAALRSALRHPPII